MDGLLDEVVTVARRNAFSHVRDPKRKAEFFCVDRSSGACVSIVVGADATVTEAIVLALQPTDAPLEYVAKLLQLGGPRDSGVVEAMYARFVRCRTDAIPSASALRRFPPPTSTQVWARALLVTDTDDFVGFAVGTDRDALAGSLGELCTSSVSAGDYDEVAYHFLRG
jgi:hypothetical protein